MTFCLLASIFSAAPCSETTIPVMFLELPDPFPS